MLLERARASAARFADELSFSERTLATLRDALGADRLEAELGAGAALSHDDVVSLARERVKGSNAAVPVSSTQSTGTDIFAKQGSPVIAVNDGKIIKVGSSAQLGRYVELQDATGNVYIYSQLGSVSAKYPVPRAVKITARDVSHELSASAGKPPTSAASAGSQVTKIALFPSAKKQIKRATGSGSAPGPSRARVRTRRSPWATRTRWCAPTLRRPQRTPAAKTAPPQSSTA